MASTAHTGRSAARRLVGLSLKQSRINHVATLLKRQKGTAAFADFPFPQSVREAVKTSVLEEATRSDSKIWSNSVNGPSHHDDHHVNGKGSIDEPISSLTSEDPLEEWYLDRQPSQFWPALPHGVRQEGADPFVLSKFEIDTLSETIRQDLLGTDHPVLNRAASYFFNTADGGKKVRPMMVVLLSRALAETADHSQNVESLWTVPLSWQRPDLPQAQRRLAEISEMIHTASLFHDDVIDGADTRRGAPAVHKVFGNKMAILAGDYLLARASISLARLRNVEVVETMSTIIEHLVRGEVMQLKGTTSSTNNESSNSSVQNEERLVYYLRKNYYKTGSLMANSCKSAALLGDYPDVLVESAYRFGKHLGIAFQLVDDVLDFEGSASTMGKPALSDLNAGLATAPVLFAAEQFSTDMLPLLDRKFRDNGDVDRAVELVFASEGIQRTKALAQVHAELAIAAILELGPSAHRDALVHLAQKVVNRTS